MDNSFYYKKGLCGLRNMGNTCYINSITQCLNNNHNLINYILTDQYKEDFNKHPSINLLEKFIDLSSQLYENNSVVVPREYLYEIKKIAEQDPCYQELLGCGQADSQEFLQFFLEKIHEQLKYKVSMNITGEIKNKTDRLATLAYKSLNTHFHNNYSKIVEEFYGLEYSKIFTPDDAEYTSETFSPFSTLALEIPEKYEDNELTLYDCLNNYTIKETNIKHSQNQEDTNTYHKQLQFWSLPNSLIIVVKRYDNFLNKKNNVINFPINSLNMFKYSIGYNNDKNIYDLYAISNHSGQLNGGHYWCYAKNLDGNWYNFNDEKVTSIEESDLISNNAYCLFYKKRT